MSDDLDIKDKIEFIYKAIEDNQNTIIFTESKAGAALVLAGILITFLSTFVNDMKAFLMIFLNNPNFMLIGNMIHVFIVALFSIGVIFLGMSIYLSFIAISPKSSPVNGVRNDTKGYIPNLFYLSEIKPKINIFNVFTNKEGYFKLVKPLSEIIDELLKLDSKNLIKLLAFELEKVSYIRELKIQRVRRSIDYLKLSFLVFFLITLATIIYYGYWK